MILATSLTVNGYNLNVVVTLNDLFTNMGAFAICYSTQRQV